MSLLWPRFKSSKYSQYSSGLKRVPAATLNQNPFFEIASISDLKFSCPCGFDETIYKIVGPGWFLRIYEDCF
jgi:hypothetical protein